MARYDLLLYEDRDGKTLKSNLKYITAPMLYIFCLYDTWLFWGKKSAIKRKIFSKWQIKAKNHTV